MNNKIQNKKKKYNYTNKNRIWELETIKPRTKNNKHTEITST